MARGNWDLDRTLDNCWQLVALLQSHGAPLEPRLGPGTTAGLASDCQRLYESSQAALQARQDKSTRHEAERELAKDAALFVTRLRGALRAAHPSDKELLTHFGVGTKVRPRSPGSVQLALAAIVHAAPQYPADKLRDAGILPQDVDTAGDSFAALKRAEMLKLQSIALSKRATADRDQIHRRVEATMSRVVVAARLTFAERSELLAHFESLLPPARGKSRGGRRRAAAPTPPAPPAEI